MNSVLDIEAIKWRLYSSLKDSGWGNKLKAFFLSSDFDTILEHLAAQVAINNRFTPPLKYLLRAFQECPYDQLKVVMLAEEPYTRLGVSDGIAFSCSLTRKEEPAIRRLFNAIETGHPGTYERNTDLVRWSHQGVLLMNCALTCQINTPGVHFDIWRPFISYLLDTLNYEKSGLVFVFLGPVASSLSTLIGDQHFKILLDNPATNTPSGTEWQHQDVFTRINETVEASYQTRIIW